MPVSPAERVLVIGIDCAPPRFVFGPDAFDLPNLCALAKAGAWGPMRSCDPPITVPAWACMTTGLDPGMLGCYGFRSRPDRAYGPMRVNDATAIREPRVWDLLSQHGFEVVCVGVPQTYPPAPVNGCMVTGILTPGPDAQYTYPKSLASELANAVGEVIFDVADFRTSEKDALLERLFAFLHNRFDVAEYLMRAKPWQFFMMVEMGLDRLHHAFWKYCDPDHPKFIPDNPYRDVFERYYKELDARVGGLIDSVGDETTILVVSDHGARAMEGGLRLNQWLIDEGYLVIEDDLHAAVRLEDCTIDWSRTTAWATGGYVGRVYLNMAGRESSGVLPPDEYEGFRDSLAVRLESLEGPDGAPLGNVVRRPEDLYRSCRRVPPDLLVYCANLRWRAIGTIGYDAIYADENDTGPDDANHDFDGVIVLDDRTGRGGESLSDVTLFDVAPTVLDLLGVPVPGNMQGKSLVGCRVN